MSGPTAPKPNQALIARERELYPERFQFPSFDDFLDRGVISALQRKSVIGAGHKRTFDAGLTVASIREVCRTNPMIEDCTQESLMMCAIRAYEYDLSFVPGAGLCWIVPYRNKGALEATFQLGYQGACELVMRTGLVDSIEGDWVGAHEVEAGLFEFEEGINPVLRHRKLPTDPGPLAFAWNLIRMKGSTVPRIHVSRLSDIEKRRKASKSQTGPWVSWFEEMALRVPLKANIRMIPKLHSAVSSAMHDDDVVDTQAEVGPSRPTRAATITKAVVDAGDRVRTERPGAGVEVEAETVPASRPEASTNAVGGAGGPVEPSTQTEAAEGQPAVPEIVAKWVAAAKGREAGITKNENGTFAAYLVTEHGESVVDEPELASGAVAGARLASAVVGLKARKAK